jgi:hypothetical protein
MCLGTVMAAPEGSSLQEPRSLQSAPGQKSPSDTVDDQEITADGHPQEDGGGHL